MTGYQPAPCLDCGRSTCRRVPQSDEGECSRGPSLADLRECLATVVAQRDAYRREKLEEDEINHTTCRHVEDALREHMASLQARVRELAAVETTVTAFAERVAGAFRKAASDTPEEAITLAREAMLHAGRVVESFAKERR